MKPPTSQQAEALEDLRRRIEYGSAHLGQTTRTRRWATEQVTEEASKGGFDADVHEAREGGGAVVRVEAGEHEMAGERGFDGDPGRLVVADLADEDHVGVLAQDGTQTGREGEAARGD